MLLLVALFSCTVNKNLSDKDNSNRIIIVTHESDLYALRLQQISSITGDTLMKACLLYTSPSPRD